MTVIDIILLCLIGLILIMIGVIYYDGVPNSIDEWFNTIFISILILITISCVISLIGVIGYVLWNADWYGLFHNKVV